MPRRTPWPCGGRRSAEEAQHIIPQELRAVYADVHAQAVELRRQGKPHAEVCEELNRLGYRTRTGKPWRHPQQIIKLLRSFGESGRQARHPASGASRATGGSSSPGR
jgi:hypothetical protein